MTYDPAMTTPTRLQRQVAEEVRALIARRRTSARQVAFALGWTEVYMSRRLNSRTPFDLNDLESIAGVLEVQIGALFGMREEAGSVLGEVPRGMTTDTRRSLALTAKNGDSSIRALTLGFPASRSSLFYQYGHVHSLSA